MAATTGSTDPYARILALGNAPTTQTGAGGQWVNAWSMTGVTAVHKANAVNAAEAWSAVKYTDALSAALAGGDIARGDLGVSGQSSASTTTKQEIDGKEALRFNLAEAAQSVSVNLSSFTANDDGTAFAEGARFRLFDAAGNLVGESFVQATGTGGNQLVQINSAQPFRAIEISAGAQRADGTFSFGGYGNGAGGFGSDSYTSGGVHGSDFLVHAISFALARPVAAADSYTLDENAPSAIFGSVLANDRDANAAPLAAVLESGAAHGTLVLNADGTFNYQPAAGFSGTDAFSYRASNGKDLSDVTVVNLTINHVNRAPVAGKDSVVTDEDTAVTGNVLDGRSGGRDTDADGDTLVVTSAGTFTTALGATVTLNANGDFTYDASASAALQALSNGASRLDGFDYSIADGHGGTATAHVDITVQGRDEASMPSAIAPSVEAGTQLVHYLHYKGASGLDKWVEIDSYSVGAEAESSAIKGSGAAVGKPAPDDFTITMGNSRAAADFTSLIVQGGHFDEVSVVSYLETPKGLQAIQQYALSDAFVTGVGTAMSSYGALQTTMSLVYKEIAQGVSAQGENGQPVKPAQVEWNVPKMQATTTDAKVPVDAVDLAHLTPTTGSDTTLDYYVRVVDAAGREVGPGWLELKGFGMDYTAITSFLKGTGASVGKAEPSEVSLDLGISALMTTLLKNQVQGTALKTIEIEAYGYTGNGSGKASLVDEYIFNNAFITGLSSNADAGNGATFVYKSFSQSHLAFDGNGKPDAAGSGSVGYDVAQGKLTPAPVAKADALEAVKVPTVNSGEGLVHYLHYKGAAGLDKWVEIDGYSVGAQSEASAIKGSGAAVGKPAPDDFTLTMGSSRAATDFTSLILQGRHFDEVSVVSYASGWSGLRPVQQYVLGDAFVTGVSTAANGDGETQTTMSLVYKDIAHGVATPGADGRPPKLAQTTWNVATTQATTDEAVSPLPAVAPAQLTPAVGSTTELDYYVRVVDAGGREVGGGWVALDGFGMDYTALASFTKGTGASVGKPVPSAVSLEMGINALLPTLLKNEITGTSLRSVEIEAYAPAAGANGKPTLVDEYIFNNVFVTDIAIEGNGASDVDFVYKSFTHSHLAYTGSGKPDAAGSGSVGYDLSAGKLATAPVAKADAVNATIQHGITADAGLTHYLHYRTAAGLDKWVEIHDYAVGAQAESSLLAGSGAAVGKPVPDDFTFTLGGSRATTDFLSLIVQGKHLDEVSVVSYMQTPAGLQAVQQYALSDAWVTGVGTANGQTTMSLVYKEIALGVSPLDEEGLPAKLVEAGWNVPKMQATASEAQVPVEPVDLSHVLPTVDASLEYYVRVLDGAGRDAAGGWVELGGFGMDYTALTSFLKGTGASVGKAVPSEVTMELGISALMTSLLRNEITGTSLKSVEIEAYSPGRGLDRKPVLVDEYIFNDAFVTDVSSESSADNAVSFVYKSFTHSHLAYDERGRLDLDDSGSVGFDVAQGKLIGVPAAHADLFQ